MDEQKGDTVKAALEMSRNEHDQYVKWKNEGQSRSKSAPRRKPTREEKVPEWFYKKEEKKTKSDKPVKSSSAIDEERRKLLEELGVTGDGTVK